MRYFVLLMTLLLTACAAQNQSLLPAAQIVEKTIIVKPPNMKMQYQFDYGNNPLLQKAYEQYQATGKAADITTDGFKQFAYGVGRQPIIAASPLELTVISLEPGENVTNVSSGDPLRWSYSLAYSGQTKKRQAHVMIKPTQSDISTDLVITTDKRMYTLKILAKNSNKYVRDIRFWYPEEMQEYWDNYSANETERVVRNGATKVAEFPDINISTLNFSYSISHGWNAPSWRPVRVFDDGTHTYIQFPQSVSARDMPALFILNDKNKELVNYRSKPPYFVVDKIFHKAVLVGSGKNVVITNNKY